MREKVFTGFLLAGTLLSVIFLFYFQNFGTGFVHWLQTIWSECALKVAALRIWYRKNYNKSQKHRLKIPCENSYAIIVHNNSFKKRFFYTKASLRWQLTISFTIYIWHITSPHGVSQRSPEISLLCYHFWYYDMILCRSVNRYRT